MSRDGLEDEPLESLGARADDAEAISLASTKRSLKYLAESEIFGMSTAEELVRNRESLRSISLSLDGISANLKRSQKHIDSIRSVFSNLKNSIFGKKQGDGNRDTEADGEGEARTIDSYVSKPKKNSFSYSFPWSSPIEESITSLRGRVVAGDIASSNNPFTTGAIEQNIESISSVVDRLKGLAAAMGEEIENQNSALGLLNDKTTDVHVRIARQERAIEKMLK